MAKLSINLLTNEKFALKTFCLFVCLRNKDTNLPSCDDTHSLFTWGPKWAETFFYIYKKYSISVAHFWPNW